LTVALAPHCGPQDIISPVRDAVEGRNCRGFGRHDSAHQIRAKVGEQVWNEYFKFTFERNPWEKIVSRYWAYARGDAQSSYKRVWERMFGQPLSFASWFRLKVWQGRLLGLGHIRLPAHYGDYTDDGRMLLDFIGRCENRREHELLLSQKLGIAIRGDLQIGAQRHRVRRPYTELFDPWMQQIVERVFQEDLKLLRYRFGKSHPADALSFHQGVRTHARAA
jgi:hypothetical protein